MGKWHLTILYRGGMGMQTPPPPTHPLQLVPEELRTEAVYLRFKRPYRRAKIRIFAEIRSRSAENRNPLPCRCAVKRQCNSLHPQGLYDRRF
jgi:hypothetical protein